MSFDFWKIGPVVLGVAAVANLVLNYVNARSNPNSSAAVRAFEGKLRSVWSSIGFFVIPVLLFSWSAFGLNSAVKATGDIASRMPTIIYYTVMLGFSTALLLFTFVISVFLRFIRIQTRHLDTTFELGTRIERLEKEAARRSAPAAQDHDGAAEN